MEGASSRTIVVMPAYNAERTLEGSVADVPRGSADEILVVDDASDDRTVEVASRLPVSLVRHPENRGYGGNQKTCYREALARGADYVVMLHPDHQYDARMIPAALDILRLDICDVVLGNRIRTRREALAGRMPLAKYVANRGLTFVANVTTGQNLGDWHSGFRAYRRNVLETIPWQRNSDDFVFDFQFLVQAVHFGFRIGDVPVPVRYFDDASSIDFSRASVYAVLGVWTLVSWLAHRATLAKNPLFLPAAADPLRP